MKEVKIVSLTNEELKNSNGRADPITIADLLLTYVCWAASFCYEMGKD